MTTGGRLLRGWRQRRRISRLELALRADSSARHISFVETGRARPGRPMVRIPATRSRSAEVARSAAAAAAGRAAGGPGAGPQRAAHRGRLRPRLPRDAAARPRDGRAAHRPEGLAPHIVNFGESGPVLHSTATTFNTPMDVTVSEPAVETFLPADPETAKALMS